MSARACQLALLVMAAMGIAAVVCVYLAGHVYFLLNHAMPRHIDLSTWYQYWLAYGDDPRQRGRLIAAMSIPAAVLTVAALLPFVLPQPQRALHGDARWATEREIREAGLL